MSFIHTAQQIKNTERERRIARVAYCKLAYSGIKARMLYPTDTHGARLTPFDMVIGEVHVMVRQVSSLISPAERRVLRVTPNSYLLMGAADISGLLAHVGRIANPVHWAVA